MIRIREISMPPEHDVNQLGYEAAKALRIPNSRVRHLQLVRRSVDARKKPQVRIVYTVDVAVEGNEEKILKQSGCKKASLAPKTRYKPPKTRHSPETPPVVVGFGPAGMFAALCWRWRGKSPLCWNGATRQRYGTKRYPAFLLTAH